MSKGWETVSVIALAIISVAVLAVIVSKQSNTSNVISAAAAGFSRSLATALSPITGGSTSSFG